MIEGLPLGGLKDEKFEVLNRSFESGDLLVMISDGLPEASNNEGEMFDYPRIKKIIESNHDKSTEDIKNIIFNNLNKWISNGIPEDDVTLVIVKNTS